MLFARLLVFLASVCLAKTYVPNIIIITTDDIGYNDIGFLHKGGEPTRTPYLDQMATEGQAMVLNNYYVMPNGHSTRSALLTGKHPAVLGTQFPVKEGTAQYGLDPKHLLLPGYLKTLGYKTHAVGQWDLGFYSRDMLPTNRGYDTFYGSYMSYGDYLSHKATDKSGYEALDLHDGTHSDDQQTGVFKPELYVKRAEDIIANHDVSKPLHLYLALQSAQIGDIDKVCKKGSSSGQIPSEYYQNLPGTSDEVRRCYLALVNKVDQSFGSIINALKNKMILSNSIVVFTSTSGGASAGDHFNAASNYPLRGAKLTGWQGGLKGAGVIFTDKVGITPQQTNCLFHVTDWIPTLLTLYSKLTGKYVASAKESFSDIYGVDQYECIFNKAPSSRQSIIHVLYGNTFVVQHHDYKQLSDADKKLESLNEWFSNRNAAICGNDSRPCDPRSKPCLYNLKNDPCEMRDISDLSLQVDHVAADIQRQLTTFNESVAYSSPPVLDEEGIPTTYWQPWVDSVNSAAVPSTSIFNVLFTITIVNLIMTHVLLH